MSTQATIVGTYRSGKSCFGDDSGLEHGFITKDYGATITSIDAPGATATEAGGVNDNGVIAGTYQTGCNGPSNTPGSFVNHGYLLQADTFSTFELPATTTVSTGLPFGGPVSVPVSLARVHDINNNNDIVGDFARSCANSNPFGPPDPTCVAKNFGFILRANGTFQALEACGQLDGPFGPGCTPGTTKAEGINDTSTVVGVFQDARSGGPNGDNVHHGFVYHGGPFTPLLCNGDPTLNTDANGINNQGIIVGGCDTNAFALFPPYRTSDYRIFSLTPNICPTTETITSTVARHISNNNKIVGSVTCTSNPPGVNQIVGFEVELGDIAPFDAPGKGTIAGLVFVPNPVTGGNPVTGTITLTAPAGPNGVLVTLTSNNGAATVPPSVTIKPGETSATFPVGTSTVTNTTVVAVTATSTNTTTGTLTINPGGTGTGTITGLSLVPNPVNGGSSSTGTVTLSAPAGPGGVVVALGSNNGSATVPPSVTIPEGQSTGTFPVSTTPVNSPTVANITATSGNTVTTPLSISPTGGGPGSGNPGRGTIIGVSVVPNPVTGGSSATGTVTLSAPAGPDGVLVTLTSGNGAAGVPVSITIPAGQNTGTFPVSTTPVAISTVANITASSGNTSSTPLIINPANGSKGTITGVSVVPNPVTGGSSATGTVTLSALAGPGGVAVTLSSNNGAASVQSVINIPGGQSNGTFTVTTTQVGSQTVATISATSGNTASTPLTINPGAGGGPVLGTITGVSVAPNPVTGGSAATGTVTISAPAGTGGVTVTLGSNNGAAGVPSSLIIPVGQNTATFPVTTTPVGSQTVATISATSANTASTPLTINPGGGGGPGGPSLGTITGVSVAPNPVTGGTSATGTVTISAPAGTGGVTVTLGSNNGAAGVPSSLIIPAGQNTATFPVTTTPVGSQTVATISATSANTASTPLTINPGGGGGGPSQGMILSVSVVPNPVTGGTSATGTVTLAAPAGAGGVAVTLGSDNGAASVPVSFTILAGQTSGTFPVTTTPVATQTVANISATSANTASTPLTINPAAGGGPGLGTITSVSVAPNPVTGGSSATGTVTISAPAGPGGVAVTLGSNNGAAGVPSGITIPAGQNTATFPVTTTPVGSQTVATISATSANTASTPLTINPGGGGGPSQGMILSVSVVPNPVTGGTSATGTVTLAAPAGAGGVAVTLGSDNGAASVPVGFTIPAGQTSGTFPVATTPVATQTVANISATSSNTASTALTINPAGGGGPVLGTILNVSVVPNPVTGGSSATGTVTLTAPAGAGGVAVTLGSDNGAAGVPAGFTIPAGQSSASFPVTTTAVASQTVANISATSANTASTPLTINPAGGGGPSLGTVIGISVSPNPVTGGSPATGTVALSAPAGPGGVMVTLGSDNGAASVPPSITIPPGQSSGTFPVNTTAVNSPTVANISATSANTVSTALTINPVAAPAAPCVGTLTLNVGAVTGGSPVTATVTLTSPAPAGGTPVQLVYTGTGVSGPSSILVNPGQTTASFTVTTATVASIVNAAIQALTGPCPGVTVNLVVNPVPVVPVTLAGVTVSPSTIAFGGSAVGTVMLNGTSATDTVVSVTSTIPGTQIGIPVNVTIPAGTSAATFTVFNLIPALSGILNPVVGTVNATLGGVSVGTAVTLQPL